MGGADAAGDRGARSRLRVGRGRRARAVVSAAAGTAATATRCATPDRSRRTAADPAQPSPGLASAAVTPVLVRFQYLVVPGRALLRRSSCRRNTELLGDGGEPRVHLPVADRDQG